MAENSVVSVHEIDILPVQFGDFLLQTKGDVFVDSGIAEVLFETLLDVFAV